MVSAKGIIYKSGNWADFKRQLSALSKKEKGDSFEVFTKYFLLSHPEYKSILQNVWLLNELSEKQRRLLNIPHMDEGIDLVALTKRGDYWAVQCKYLEEENQTLSHRKVSTFGNLAFAMSGKFAFGLVCTTAERFANVYKTQERISFCTGEVWRSLTREQFDNIRQLSHEKPVKLSPYIPFAHQQRAIKNAVQHFVKEKQQRGKLILPCGSGKSLTGFWIAEKLNAKTIMVAVPSLALVRQTLNTWLRESVAHKKETDWICVCSDESIGKQDDNAVLVQDLGIPCVTDVQFIARWLKKTTRGIKVVFTTYQSGEAIAAAARKASCAFDLGIMDEAHKTVGQAGKLFTHLLFDKNIRIHHRVFMTATERRYLGQSEEIASMDNPEIYGDTFELLTFKEALEVQPPILSDYRIITVVVGRQEVQELVKKNAYVKPDKGAWNSEVEAATLTAMIALRKAMQRYPIKHAVSFHSSIARAKAFADSQETLTGAVPGYEPIDTYHVTGATPTATRSNIIASFARAQKSLITNARCLTEGVDVPNIDCVLFADPKRSTIDIVQAVGRALRVAKGKRYGYVIIPVLSDDKNGEQVIDDASYSELLLTLRALASNDERIIEYFRLKREKGLSKGRKPTGDDLVEIYAENIDLEKLVEDVELKVWNRLAKLSWRPFEEAREYVRKLNLESRTEWEHFCNSKIKPEDIPVAPNQIYKDKGWINWGDWLGTDRIANQLRTYLPFEEAKKIVKNLGLKNQKEWNDYSNGEIERLGKRPLNIPGNPVRVYRNNGWKDWADWLGSIYKKNIAYRSFLEAKKFVSSLGLKDYDEWRKYCKGELNNHRPKPDDIPSGPSRIYKDTGWNGYGDWLGTGKISDRKKVFRPFVQAREFARKLGLKNLKEWQEYSSGRLKERLGERPIDIPATPATAYKNKGWISWGDWLGTNSLWDGYKEFLPFSEARKTIHKLNLKRVSDWNKYYRKIKPKNLPSKPDRTYKNFGWNGWKDWLGVQELPSEVEFLSFDEAKKIVADLKLKSNKKWREYSKTQRPNNIPANPDKVYVGKWKGWEYWLGKNDT